MALLGVKTSPKKETDLAFTLGEGLVKSTRFVAQMATEIEDRLKTKK